MYPIYQLLQKKRSTQSVSRNNIVPKKLNFDETPENAVPEQKIVSIPGSFAFVAAKHVQNTSSEEKQEIQNPNGFPHSLSHETKTERSIINTGPKPSHSDNRSAPSSRAGLTNVSSENPTEALELSPAPKNDLVSVKMLVMENGKPILSTVLMSKSDLANISTTEVIN